ncbi:MAG: bifunctional UDP-N-acetylglucosamine diphosphorylase/glucosamine-1-phosphate N-acetyltransferase GlmU [Thermodesulfobacteriota bacterium]
MHETSGYTLPAASGALVLAAGKGTRMKSERPKVLASLLGEPMLWYALQAAGSLCGERVWTVVGHCAEEVRAAFPDDADRFLTQEPQLGTGHALQTAWPALRRAGLDWCLVVNGDAPLADASRLADFVRRAMAGNADLAFLALSLDDPGAYGRVLRDPAGGVSAIVEAKDWRAAGGAAGPGEINAGIYWLRLDAVEPLLSRLSADNAGGEFYITDLVGLAKAAGLRVEAVNAGGDPHLLGINSPVELARTEGLLRERIVRGLLESGVTVHWPELVAVGPRAVIEPGAELSGPSEILGASRVAAGAVVQSHCVLLDAVLESGCEVRSFSHLEDAAVGPQCVVGPYARLRPGAVLEEGARVGNFVEMKKAVLKRGAKANHLTYLGDAEVGAGANVGAGTITCNYDGKRKHRTVIGAGAFIGSNTALVAPVTVGENALVGAGSVITKDVEPGHLALTRAPQRQLPRRK